MSRPPSGLLLTSLVLWSPAALACGNDMEGDRIPFLIGGTLLAAVFFALLLCVAAGGLVFFLVRRRQAQSE